MAWNRAGDRAAEYAVRVERGNVLSLRRRNAGAEGFGTIAQQIEAEGLRGSRLRFSAEVRSRDVTGWAGLWMRVDGENGVLAFDNMQDRPITGTEQWARYEVGLDVADEAHGVGFGLLIVGPGKVWLRKVRLEREDGSEVPLEDPDFARLAASSRPARDEAVEALRKLARPITSTRLRSGSDDLRVIDGIVDGARVVAFGEATHGTREFFELKSRTFEYLATEHGFTIFGLEANYTECLVVNEYVLHGVGTARDALTGTRFWTWNTREILELIEWMRDWNRSANQDRKVKFYGFDMQFPSAAALAVIDELRRVDTALAERALLDLAPLATDTTAMQFSSFPDDERVCAHQIIDEAEVALSSHDPLVRLHVTALRQAADQIMRPMDSAHRDRCMAENTIALLDAEGPSSRAMLWAHNGHVAKNGSTRMGSHLARELGNQYVVVGFAFNRGAFQAIDSETKGLRNFSVRPAPRGFLDAGLARIGHDVSLIDLKSVPPGPTDNWLRAGPASRSIGALFNSGWGSMVGQTGDPRDAYDALIFVDRTTAARRNASGRRPSVRKPPDPPAAPRNLDLRAGLEGWEVVKRDHRVRFTPGAAITIARARGVRPWGDGVVSQRFSAAKYRGKTVHFSALISAKSSGHGFGAHLFVTSEAPDTEDSYQRASLASSSSVRLSVRSGTEKRNVQIDIADEAATITIGMILSGDGRARFSQLQFS